MYSREGKLGESQPWINLQLGPAIAVRVGMEAAGRGAEALPIKQAHQAEGAAPHSVPPPAER